MDGYEAVSTENGVCGRKGMIYFILFLFDYDCREICRRSRRPGGLGRGRICDPVTVGRAVGNVTTFSIRFFPSGLSCPSVKVCHQWWHFSFRK